MKTSRFLALLLLAAPLAALAQTKPAPATTTKPAKPTTTTTAPAPPATQQQTEVTEDLDPVTGKVIRRTTRTINVPVGTAPGPGTTVINPSSPSAGTAETVRTSPATDTAVSDFFRERTTVARLTAPQLLSAYTRFIDKVRDDRRSWQANDWARAANVLSSLNGRYEQLRGGYTLDDKLTIRGVQGEFQALRTARQISSQVSDKL